MGKAFGISMALHVIALSLIAFWRSLFPGHLEPPTRVFRVSLVAASEPMPQEEVNPPPAPERTPMPGLPSRKSKPKKVETPPTRTLPQQSAIKRPGVGSLTIEGENFDNPLYINMIFQKVAMNWHNPLAKGGRAITCIVYFRILRTGVISDIALKTHSGNMVFDQSCLAAVKVAGPLPPLPEEYSGDFIGINFEFQHQP